MTAELPADIKEYVARQYVTKGLAKLSLHFYHEATMA
jgi:hypothetical protein